MKKILILMLVGLLLVLSTGCSAKDGERSDATSSTQKTEEKGNDQKEENEGTISTSKLKQLTLDEAFKKIDNKERFVFVVTQSTCGYCDNFKLTLVPFLREHPDIPFYEIEVDMLGTMKADINKNFDRLQKKVKDFQGGTPETFCYENGKVKKSASGAMTEAQLTNFMIDCGFIQGKKVEEEKAETYDFEESRYIKFDSLIDIAKRIDKKEKFYLLICESDRYSQGLIKTLIPVLEQKKIEVAAIRFPISQGNEDKSELEKAYQTVMKSTSDLTMTPTLYKIENGKGTKLVEDNVAKEVILGKLDK